MNTSFSPTDRRQLLTEREVASLFRVTPRTVRRWATIGELDAVRVGGVTRYRADRVAALMDPTYDQRPAAEPGAGATSPAECGDGHAPE